MMADSVLLPQLVKPLRYEIYLAPDLEKTYTCEFALFKFVRMQCFSACTLRCESIRH